MEFRILGPVEVWDSGRSLSLGGAKQRALLAILLIQANQVVPTHRLIDLIWPQEPPDTADHSLQVYVSQLRKVLEPQHHVGKPHEVLVSQTPGYLVRVAGEDLDLVRFQRLVEEGRQALSERAHGEAGDKFREALALWRGPALADFASLPFAINEAARLEELKLRVLEDRIGADLALGHHADLVSELETLVGESPMRERLRGQLMLALYRSGRQAEASDVFHGFRRLLTEASGMDPGPELQTLLKSILNQDPSLDLDKSAGMARQGNLPLASARFIGRSEQMQEVKRLLESVRLLTLVGAGGVGKTRLALELAREVQDQFRDGAWVVELGSLSDPDLLTHVIASTLRVRDQPGKELVDSVIDSLRPRQVLLLLDNCEHLIDGAAHFSDLILKACPNVCLLATSREPLNIDGERVWRVPSLTVPAERHTQLGEDLSGYSALAFFSQRALEADPSFRLSEDNLEAVVRICRALDGIPLAIELAVGKLQALSVQQLANRLDERFRILTGGSRTKQPRQQTLLATVEWSYNLLSDPECQVLRRLGLFQGEFSLASVHSLNSDAPLATDLVGIIDGLISKSLVQADTANYEARYSLLETIRYFALEQLTLAGERESSRRLYVDYYVELASALALQMDGLAQGHALNLIKDELSNLRAAIGYCREAGYAEAGAEIACGTWRYWIHRGPISEGTRWLEEVFRISGDISTWTRAEALSVNSQLFLFQGAFGKAQQLAEEALKLWREVDDKGGIAVTLHDLGSIALYQGETDRAREMALQGLAMRRELGGSGRIAHSLNGLAEIERYCGNYEAAETLLMEATSLCPVEDPMLIGMRGNLAHIALNQHKHEAAERLLNDALPIWRAYEDRTALTEYLVGMAGIRVEQRRFETGARLLGAIAAEVVTSGLMLWPTARAEYDRYSETCRLELGDAANAEAIRAGRHLDIDSAINLALELPAITMESR